jgi:hypothetical protein
MLIDSEVANLKIMSAMGCTIMELREENAGLKKQQCDRVT